MGADAETRTGIKVAVLFLQPDCNMHCSFCVTEDGFDTISLTAASELLDRLRRQGVRSVVLGGGEPFTWPGDVVELAARGKQTGLLVQIGTNGIALPAGFAELACVDRYVLPLESADAAVHNAMRRYGGRHHGIVLDRLDELRRAGKSVTISTVLTATNRAGIPALADCLARYHATGGNLHAWHLYQFLPLGRGGAANREALAIPAADYGEICDRVQDMGLPFLVFRRTNMYRSRTVEFYWSEHGSIRCGPAAR